MEKLYYENKCYFIGKTKSEKLFNNKNRIVHKSTEN